jgi:hypothetical protein
VERAETLITRSVYVCGIFVKEMLEAPPAPTVTVCNAFIVFAIIKPP